MSRRPTKTFWDRTKEAMRDAGLTPTQDAAARLIGIRQPSVNEWTKPGGYPTLENGINLAMKIGACVEWLYTGRGPRSPPPSDPTAQRLWDLWGRIDDVSKGEIVRLAIERASPPGQAPPTSKRA